MEEKVKSIPVTVADVLAFLVPGLIWLFLLVTAGALYDIGDKLPLVVAWERLDQFANASAAWLVALGVVVGALLTGYALKPLATTFATYLVWPFLVWFYESRIYFGWSIDVYGKTLKFPFDETYKDKHYYKLTKDRVTDLLKYQIDPNDQNQDLNSWDLFHMCRRYLWANAPALSELADRREAEVRMFATLFLGALLSLVFAAYTLACWWGELARHPQAQIWAWLGGSFVAATVFAHGFIRLRLSEVKSVYYSTLVAIASKK